MAAGRCPDPRYGYYGSSPADPRRQPAELRRHAAEFQRVVFTTNDGHEELRHVFGEIAAGRMHNDELFPFLLQFIVSRKPELNHRKVLI